MTNEIEERGSEETRFKAGEPNTDVVEVAEIASRINRSERTVRGMLSDGTIPRKRLGDRQSFIVPRRAFERWIRGDSAIWDPRGSRY